MVNAPYAFGLFMRAPVKLTQNKSIDDWTENQKSLSASVDKSTWLGNLRNSVNSPETAQNGFQVTFSSNARRVSLNQ